MALYSLTDLLELTKEDMGLLDFPSPFTDEQLISRFERSVLPIFSLLSPRIEDILITESDRDPKRNDLVYIIPDYKLNGMKILSVYNVEPYSNVYNYSDPYQMTSYNSGTPEEVLSFISDVRLSSTISQSITAAPTFRFTQPNILKIYNGFQNMDWKVTIGCLHDLSLSSIDDGTFLSLRKLTLYDMQEFFYNNLKRKTKINTGTGQDIDLLIDDWANASDKKEQLLTEWSNDANLDFDVFQYQ